MKKTARIIALILLAAMLLCLTGCGSFETKMAKAAKKMAALQSVHMDLDMHMDFSMSLLGESLDLDANMESGIDMQTEPLRAKMEMGMEVMGVNMDMLMYLEQNGEEYTAYVSADNGASWERETMTAEEAKSQTGDVSENLKIFINCAKSFQEAGTEMVNGSEATRYDGEITGDSLESALELSGAKEMLGEGLGGKLSADAFTGLESIPCSVWIDNKSGMVVRYDMDMGAVMQTLMKDMMDEVLASQGLEGFEMEMEFREVTVSVVLSQFDAVGEIVIPDSVKAA